MLRTGASRLYLAQEDSEQWIDILRSFFTKFFQEVARIIRGIDLEKARLKANPRQRAKKGELASASTAAQSRLVFIRFMHYLCSGDTVIMSGSILQLLSDARNEQRRLNNGFRKQSLYLRAIDQQNEIAKTFELLLLLKESFVELSRFFAHIMIYLKSQYQISDVALENAEENLFQDGDFRAFIHQAAIIALLFTCNGQRLQVQKKKKVQ